MAQPACRQGKIVVIGVGNRMRRDDGAGLAAVETLRNLGLPGVEAVTVEGECAGLVERWGPRDCVFIVDAVRGGEAGAILAFDAARGPVPGEWFRVSGHSFGVNHAVELARALGRLPRRLTIYGIVGKDFGEGEGLSAEVEAATAQLVDTLRSALDG